MPQSERVSSVDGRGDEGTPRAEARPIAMVAAFAWLVVLVVGPLALWHQVLHDILVSFHWSFRYAMMELTPWFLLLAGIVFLVPVALSAGRHPESRLYPRSRRVYFAWGVVLYLLGCALTIQVVDVWSYAH